MVTNELATILGAFFGFIIMTWPLIGAARDAPAAWSYLPTSISGMGALLIGWISAIAGAWLALLLLDGIAYCGSRATCTSGADVSNMSLSTVICSGEAASASSLTVPLASNGARPCMKERLEAFVVEEGKSKQKEMLVAAGGPQALLESMKKTLPAHLHLLELTHPM